MARTINDTLLFQYLLELKEKDPLGVPENIRYLMEAVVTPLLNDQPVRLTDLNFDRFDKDALDALEQYVNELTGKNDHQHQRLMDFQLGRLSPLCVGQPIFC